MRGSSSMLCFKELLDAPGMSAKSPLPKEMARTKLPELRSSFSLACWDGVFFLDQRNFRLAPTFSKAIVDPSSILPVESLLNALSW